MEIPVERAQALPRRLVGTEGDAARIRRDDAAEGEAPSAAADRRDGEAKLVLTDELVRQALRREKAAKREAARRERKNDA